MTDRPLLPDVERRTPLPIKPARTEMETTVANRATITAKQLAALVEGAEFVTCETGFYLDGEWRVTHPARRLDDFGTPWHGWPTALLFAVRIDRMSHGDKLIYGDCLEVQTHPGHRELDTNFDRYRFVKPAAFLADLAT